MSIFWIASYPKSGNTWMRMGLACLRRGAASIDINNFQDAEDAAASNRERFDLLCDVDSSDLTEPEILAARAHVFRRISSELRGVAFWKVHEAFVRTPKGALFPAEATAGCVYIVRDPRDVAVSLAHHNGSGIDDAIARLADPDHTLSRSRHGLSRQLHQPLSTWSGHVESWLDQASFPILLVRYEDMLKDFGAVLERVSLLAGLRPGDAAIRQAVEATRFSELQRQEHLNGFAEKPFRCTKFFRDGRAEGWRDTLTAAQSDRISGDHRVVMKRLGYC